MPIVWIVVGILLAACVVLLLHHRYHHRTGGPQPLPEGMDQWFQESDVCNFHSCSHEMWILGLMSVAGILIVYTWVNDHNGLASS